MSTIQALGSLGEFVGALAVVISLVYLARQMIQNTNSVRAASFNSMVQNSIRLLEHAFRDSEFADFLYRAERDPASLTPSETVRWDAYMTAVFRHFGNLVYQRRVGALDEQMWESYRRTLKEHLRMPSWGEWFRRNEAVFSDALCDEVACILAELASEAGPGASSGAAGKDESPARPAAGEGQARPVAEEAAGGAGSTPVPSARV